MDKSDNRVRFFPRFRDAFHRLCRFHPYNLIGKRRILYIASARERGLSVSLRQCVCSIYIFGETQKHLNKEER